MLAFCLLQGFVPVLEHLREGQLEQRVASDMSRVASAAQAYVQAHIQELFTQADKERGPTWQGINGLPEQISAYLLHAHSGRNPLDWYYTFFVRKFPLADTDAHALMLIVICQGETRVSDKVLKSSAHILAKLCQSLPVERYHEMAGYLGEDSVLIAGSARLDLGEYGIRAPAGSLAYVATLLGAEAWARVYGHDQLYRTEVPGMPMLNRMATDLDLGQRKLLNVAGLALSPVTSPSPETGTLFFQADQAGETPGLYYFGTHDTEPVRHRLLDTSTPHLRGLYVLGAGARLIKPECATGKAAITVTPLASPGQERAHIAYYEEDAVSWTIGLREENDLGLWQESQGQVQVVTYCIP